ncbi:putative ribonuclease H-like domain-containing protein [Tanacetum coccineum]
MTTLADKAILSGSDNRPPMLEKDYYDSWKSRMELYMMNRQHGQMILESVENGPLIWPTIEDNGVIRQRKYSKLSVLCGRNQADCDVQSNKYHSTRITTKARKREVYRENHEDPLTQAKEWDTFDNTITMMTLTGVEQDDWTCSKMREASAFWTKDGLGDFDWSNKDDDTSVSLALMATNSEGNPEEDLKDYAIIDSGCSGSMTGDKDKLSYFKSSRKGKQPLGHLARRLRKKLSENLFELLHMELFGPSNGIQFWAEAVNTACYVLNRVLVTKPQLKTPYEILMGRSPNISFMRPFGCSLTILNTLDHLGKFDGKSEEGYLLGYSTNSKGFRVYNRITRKVQDCLHVNFLENQENQKGKGPDWISAYASRGTMSLMHQESLAKLHNDDQRIAFEEEKKRIALDKGKECVDSTFTLSTANTPPQSTGNTPTDSDDDIPKDGVFSTNSFDAEEGGVADYNNMDPTIDVPSTPTLRIHKIHPQSQIIGKSTAGVQTRRKLKESTSDQHQALLSFIYKQNRTNHKDQQTCLFACFLSQEEPKKVSQALADESWVEAMQEELLQFKLQEVWVLCDLLDEARG